MIPLIYTFRTFPWIAELPKPFVFGKIKEDLPRFRHLIDQARPNLIVGIAKSTLRHSTIEARVINRFNNRMIDQQGVGSYELDTLPGLEFALRQTPTNSFCNYVAYKTAAFIEGRDISHILVHVVEADIPSLCDIITLQRN